MNLKKTKKILAISAVAFLVLLPAVVLAQLPGPTVPTVAGTTLNEIEATIERVARFMLAIGVVLAIVFIIWGGVKWMMAGGDDTKIKTAKTQIWSGVWGALIIIAVGLILQTLARVVTRVFFQ